MKLYQLIEIAWRDSAGASGWTKIKDIECSPDAQLVHKTVGYFLKQNKNTILLVQSLREDKYYGDGIFEIPLKCIIKIKKLHYGKS